MLHIALCDDNPASIEILEKYFDILNDSTIDYDVYFSAEELYRYKLNNELTYDIYILDKFLTGNVHPIVLNIPCSYLNYHFKTNLSNIFNSPREFSVVYLFPHFSSASCVWTGNSTLAFYHLLFHP